MSTRIVSYVLPLGNQSELLARSILEGAELGSLLPPDYKGEHLRRVGLLDRYLKGEEIEEPDRLFLAELGIAPEEAASSVEQEPVFAFRAEGEDQPTLPKVIVTTLVGAKGLQANHVFMVGMNDGHFPRNNARPTNDEICRLLVGLTRTKKQCHLVSFGMFAGRWWEESVFLSWLRPTLRSVKVDRSYFDAG